MSEQHTNSINKYLLDIFKLHNITFESEENGWINFPRRNDAPFYAYQTRQPKIKGEVVERRQHPQTLVVQIDILLHLLDGRILCESFAGMGANEKSSIENGIANFLNSSFHVLANAFYFQKGEQVSTKLWEINGEKWRVFLGNLVGRGEISDISVQPPDNVFPVFEKLIRSQKLKEDCHWFNWFCANSGNKTTQCEALFDNQVWQEASEKLRNCNWEKRKEYYTYRNFVVLVNEDYYASKSFILDDKNRNTFSERLIGIQLKNIIATAVEIYKQNQNVEDFELSKAFVKNGITLNVAERLIEFVPLAYARAFLEGSGARFENYYQRVNENGKLVESEKLIDVPIYAEAFKLAQQEINTDFDKEKFISIAWRSAEMRVLNEALSKGSKIEDLVFAPPTLIWADDLQTDYYKIEKKPPEIKNIQNFHDQKSWWQIWK